MAWLILIIAGLVETGWAIGLKYTDGFTRFWPSVFTVTGIVVSMILLSISAHAADWDGLCRVGRHRCCRDSDTGDLVSR